MKSEKRRYFDKNHKKLSKNLKPGNKFRDEEKKLGEPYNEKSDNIVNNEVEVYNIKITPKLLKNQRFRNASRAEKSIRDKKNERFPGRAPIDPQKLAQHSRGEGIGKGVRHPLYAEKLKKKERKYDYAQEQAARADILLTENQGGLEVGEDVKTTAISQKIIAQNVDIAAASKIFELNLEFGPYRAKYSKNGRHLLLGSKKGHVAAFDWVTKKLHCEMNVMESIHDISWLHIETMMAVAQKEWLYIYDNTGTELHCLKRMDKILRMEFLPYHFLLAAVNEYGFMTWLDISIGEIVGHYNNRLGRTAVMTQNPYNATLCLGNSKGVVSLWSPSVKEPLAKILCHKTPLTAIAVDSRGMYMATSGVDRSMKIWDIRNLDGPLQDYRLRSAPVELEFSQTDMLAVGLGEVVEVYNNCCTQSVDRPYMRHRMGKSISNFKFCPYEDVLGVGTSRGFTSIIIPGSGEPNFDALESNPFQTKSQRKEAEVKALLEKIPAELITLNPFEVTEVDVPSVKEQMEAKKSVLYVKPKKVDFTPRHKNKGKNSIARKKIIKDTTRKILTALNFYGKGSYQGAVGHNLDGPMAQQTVSKCLRQVTEALNNPAITRKYFKFPQNRQERNTIKERFYERHGIPGVIGCIDCTHIAIVRPHENEERFFNRKHFHSLNCQMEYIQQSIEAKKLLDLPEENKKTKQSFGILDRFVTKQK